tara:strand:- start:79 stop:309 length:231 start_codon:yes stop_codon:yes gene_type:complete
MNSSIMMDIIISLIIVFGYYLFTKFDKSSEELDRKHIIVLFIISMVVLNVIKLLFSCNVNAVDSNCSIPFHDKPPF